MLNRIRSALTSVMHSCRRGEEEFPEVGLLDVFKPVIDAPKIWRDVLTEMANDDLEIGMSIEDADSGGPISHLLSFHSFSNMVPVGFRVPFRPVIEDHVIAVITRSLGVIHQCTFEPELQYAALQLCRCFCRIMHGKRTRAYLSAAIESTQRGRHARKATKSIFFALDLLYSIIVDLSSKRVCFLRIIDVLHARGSVGEDLVADIVLIHILCPNLSNVGHLAGMLLPIDGE
ncbi:2,3-dihydroxybenzoate [Hortaea werneckii]|nr:2,3-dihydroxybenzoate [Hortaea werneckii]